MKADIAPAQLRAVRALVDWSRGELAEATGTTVRTLGRFEAGETMLRAVTRINIRTALEAAGVEFIEQNGGGPVMRLRSRGQS